MGERHITDAEAEASSDPAAAFEALTREVALLRRATEGLSAEKARLEMPDYEPTLGAMEARLAAIDGTIETMAGKAALKLTPEALAQQIDRAAETSRRSDAARLDKACEGHRQATYAIQSLVGTMRGQHEQRRHLQIAIAGGIAAGCLFWSIMPGVVLRAMPTSWHMPESMAAHIIGEPSLWEAGSRMMRAGDPGSWRSIILAIEMRRDNLEAIEACERRAMKTGKPVRCTLRIDARDRS